MKTPPYMPLYWGDYLRDTYDLTAEEHGAYLLLLGALWTHGGEIPVTRAQQLSRVRPQRWIKVWRRIAVFFEVTTVIKQRRVTMELSKHRDRSNEAAKAAKVRWSAHANAMPTQSERNASQIQIQNQEDPDQRERLKKPKGYRAEPRTAADVIASTLSRLGGR